MQEMERELAGQGDPIAVEGEVENQAGKQQIGLCPCFPGKLP